jgi:serine/threonine protein kinase
LIDDGFRPKIADFGWTRLKAEDMTGKIGTYQWMAPEVITSQKYTEKADVFSFGIIMWEIAAREPPYRSKHICILYNNPSRYRRSLGES